MNRQRTAAIALALLMALSLPAFAMPTLADEDDRDIVTVDSDHDLTDQATIDDWRSDGYATTELSQLDATLSIASDGDDVGLEDRILPSDVRNDYIELDYREDFERTLRIHIPREYTMPYTQSGVGSVTTDHYADYEPARGGDYLEVTIHVDEPGTIVLPIQRDSAASYRAVEWADSRIEAVTGHTAFSGEEWEYISGDTLTANGTIELEGNPDDMVVQYDAYAESTDETWLNAPHGEDDDAGVHVLTRSVAGNETATLVATADDPPDVRYKPEAEPSDRAEGWLNDAREIPSRISDAVGGLGDWIPLTVIP